MDLIDKLFGLAPGNGFGALELNTVSDTDCDWAPAFCDDNSRN